MKSLLKNNSSLFSYIKFLGQYYKIHSIVPLSLYGDFAISTFEAYELNTLYFAENIILGGSGAINTVKPSVRLVDNGDFYNVYYCNTSMVYDGVDVKYVINELKLQNVAFARITSLVGYNSMFFTGYKIKVLDL